jgi:putative ABC transport system permease protein
MKYLYLVWRNLLRRKVRTLFTLGCILVSFVLYAFLMIVRAAFTMGIDFAGADRMWTIHKVSIIQMLPESYLKDILATPGVRLATYGTWFGGSYQNKPNQFAVFATDIETYLKLYHEFKVDPAQLKSALEDVQGVVVGKDTAARYGWKVGDRIPILADIWQPVEGQTWYFNIRAIYDGEKTVDKTQFLFNRKYFEENRRFGKGTVNFYMLKIEDPAQGAAIAKAIDTGFANSQYETKTAPEKAVIADFAKQTGDIGAMITAILVVVFFTILIVVANTMAQSVRERTSELAVLKTLGFQDGTILMLVLGESVFLSVLAGGIALGLMAIFVGRGTFNTAMLPVFVLSPQALILGGVLAVMLGLVSGALPAIGAMRLKITDALRRN